MLRRARCRRPPARAGSRSAGGRRRRPRSPRAARRPSRGPCAERPRCRRPRGRRPPGSRRPAPRHRRASPSPAATISEISVRVRRSTPFSRCRSANIAASSGPSGASSGSGSRTSTLTVQPAARAAAATSRPIHPPPTTTTRRPAVRSARRRSLSWSVRRWTTPSRPAPGTSRRRGSEPVARTRWSQPVRVPESSTTSRAAEVDLPDGRPQPEVDVVGAVPVGRVHERVVALVAALQVALRQRRPLVRPLRLGPQQDDPSVVPPLPQTLDGLRPRQPGTHDHDLTAHVTPLPSPDRRRQADQVAGAGRNGAVWRSPRRSRARSPRRMRGRLAPWGPC